METKDKSKKKAKKYEKEKKSSIKEDMEFQSAAPRLRKTLDKKCEENEEKSEKSEVLKVAPSGPTLKGKPDTDQKSLIVSKQKFDGSWDLIEIAYLLGISLQTAQQATPSLAAEEVWATALGVAFFGGDPEQVQSILGNGCQKSTGLHHKSPHERRNPRHRSNYPNPNHSRLCCVLHPIQLLKLLLKGPKGTQS